jgi:hypothetical protein
VKFTSELDNETGDQTRKLPECWEKPLSKGALAKTVVKLRTPCEEDSVSSWVNLPLPKAKQWEPQQRTIVNDEAIEWQAPPDKLELEQFRNQVSVTRKVKILFQTRSAPPKSPDEIEMNCES